MMTTYQHTDYKTLDRTLTQFEEAEIERPFPRTLKGHICIRAISHKSTQLGTIILQQPGSMHRALVIEGETQKACDKFLDLPQL
jgi:hypothetical protein